MNLSQVVLCELISRDWRLDNIEWRYLLLQKTRGEINKILEMISDDFDAWKRFGLIINRGKKCERWIKLNPRLLICNRNIWNDSYIMSAIMNSGYNFREIMSQTFLRNSTPIVLPIHDDRLDIAKIFIKNGADINSKYFDAYIIHQASYNGNSVLVKLLTDAGANPDTKNDGGETPICVILDRARDFTLEQCHKETMNVLLKAGANIDGVSNSFGGTYLHNAIDYPYPDVANFLIDAGANVNAVDFFMRIPLHLILNYIRRFDIIPKLLKAGANIHAKDRVGRTPLELLDLKISHALDIISCKNMDDIAHKLYEDRLRNYLNIKALFNDISNIK